MVKCVINFVYRRSERRDEDNVRIGFGGDERENIESK